MNEIDARSLQQKLAGANPPLIVDVRNVPELAEGRIEGSVHIPMNELPARLAEVPEGRDVVTVCKKGMRSFNAAGWLRQMGRSAVSLQGGIDQWKALGLPVAR
ncbi:MAG: sulfurtransferase [Deltaproteobacteria bacterium]|jgi:hydroxyacylglutathione hydrolase|nr:MAG: sulfurtransferase [Deltaproteobacteria bacterium]TMA76989.1 MAG: sulfurtransferase [Deltaproteobacteria bacterium]TMB35887.1 MAG: sulfurtransferase [Deltaproteobacteria bacterium]